VLSRLLDTFFQDARFALRGFRARPLFTLVAILTLALAIGGNTAIFSMIRAVLLRPLPWLDPDRLVIVWETNPKQGVTRSFPSSANFFDWREQSRSFDALAPWRAVSFNLAGDPHRTPERVPGARVGPDFLAMLGGRPELGRSFLPEEDQPGRDRVVILSHNLWQRRFGGNRTLLGTPVLIDGEPVTVVGVLPPQFRLMQVLNHDLDIFLPLTHDPRLASRDDHSFNVYGRLRPSVSVARAESELNAIAERLGRAYPATNRDWRARVIPLPEAAVANGRPLLFALAAAVAIVLVIACVNLAGLLTSRANARAQEFAIRLAVGGSRARVTRQLLTESALLGLIGGAAGLLLAFWALPVLNLRIPSLGMPRIHQFRLDAWVLGFNAVASLVAGLLFGLAPAARFSRVDWIALKSAATRRQGRGRVLVLSEVVLTTVLLIAGGSALKTAIHLVRMDRGLDVRQVLTTQIWLPEARYPGARQLSDFFADLLPRVRALPGVESASVVNYPPLGLLGTSVPVDRQAANERRDAPTARYWIVSPDYRRTVRLPLLRGRSLEERDTEQTAGAAVISARLAERLFPGEDALGKALWPRFPANTNAFWIPYATSASFTVVGIVPDIVEDGLLSTPLPQMYFPWRQSPARVGHLLVRAANPQAIARAIRSAVQSVDPGQAVSEIRSLESLTGEAFSRQTVASALLAVFAALALLLASVGIYGVVAAAVGGRTREMGIRIALGARRGRLVSMIVGEAMLPVWAGTAIGLPAARWLDRALASRLAGLEAWDLAAASAVCAILIAVAALASYIPALRASKADPILALRSE
jgi:putative ABC transport system permease protein